MRESPAVGPYIQGITSFVVENTSAIHELIAEGQSNRRVGATAMNAESSRSHAVLMLSVTHKIKVGANTGEFSDEDLEKTSTLNLVDLAGSDRQNKSQAQGARLEEGNAINKSLSTLGMVINALVKAANSATPSMSAKHIPYRDSVLTWLLKESFGGNSKTVMIATLSPALDNYDETISTLQYADNAKQIINMAVINDGASAKIIREQQQQIEALKGATSSHNVAKLGDTYEEKLHRTKIELLERPKFAEACTAAVFLQASRVEKKSAKLTQILSLCNNSSQRITLQSLDNRLRSSSMINILVSNESSLPRSNSLESLSTAGRIDRQLTKLSVTKSANEDTIKELTSQITSEKEVREGLEAASTQRDLETRAARAVSSIRIGLLESHIERLNSKLAAQQEAASAEAAASQQTEITTQRDAIIELTEQLQFHVSVTEQMQGLQGLWKEAEDEAAKHHSTHNELLQLQTEGAELKAELKAACLALQDAQCRFTKLDKDHKAALAAAAEYDKHAATQCAKLERLTADHTMAQTRLTTDHTAAQMRTKEQDARVAGLMKQTLVLGKTTETLQSTVEQLTEQVWVHKQELAGRDAHSSKTEGQLQKTATDLEQHVAMVSELQAQLDRLDQNFEKVMGEHNQIQIQLEEQTLVLAQHEIAKAAHESQLHDAHAELDCRVAEAETFERRTLDITTKLEELSTLNKELQATAQAKESELETQTKQAGSSAAELMATIALLEDSSAADQATAMSLTEELESKGSELLTLQQRFDMELISWADRHGGVEKQHEAAVASSEQTAAMLTTQNEELSAKLESITSTHDAVVAKHGILAGANAVLTGKHEALEKAHESLNVAHDELAPKHREVFAQQAKAEREKATILAKHTALSSVHVQLQGINVELTDKHEVLTTKQHELQQKVGILSNLHGQLTEVHSKLTFDYTKLKTEHVALQEQHGQLQNELAAAVATSEERAANLRNQTAKRSIQLEQLRSTKTAVEEQLASEKASAAVLAEKLASKTDTLGELQSRFDTTWTNLSEAKAASRSKEEQLRTIATIAELKAAVTAAKEEGAQASADWQTKYDALKSEFESKHNALKADWKGKQVSLQLEWEAKQNELDEAWTVRYGELKASSEEAAAALQAEGEAKHTVLDTGWETKHAALQDALDRAFKAAGNTEEQYKGAVAGLEKQVADQKAANELLMEKLSGKADALTELQGRYDASSSTLTTLQTEHANAVAANKEHGAHLGSQITDLNSQLEQFRAAKSAVDEQLTSEKAAGDVLTEKLSGKTYALGELQGRFDATVASASALTEQHSTLQSEYADAAVSADKKIASMASEIETLAAKQATLEAANSKLADQFASEKAAGGWLGEALSRKVTKLTELQSHFDTTSKSLAELQITHDANVSSMDELHASHNEAVSSLDAEVVELSTQIATLQQAKAELEMTSAGWVLL